MNDFTQKESQDFKHFSELIKIGLAIWGADSGQSYDSRTGYKAFTTSQKNAGRAKARTVLQFLDLCSCCGADATERHHKDSNPTNNDRGNLVPLCGTCHQLAHGKYPNVVGRPSTVSYAWRNPA